MAGENIELQVMGQALSITIDIGQDKGDRTSAGSRRPPKPFGTPVEYAYSLGRWHSDNFPAERRKQHGQFFTPPEVATYMAGLTSGAYRRILDPGAGTGILSCAAVQRALESGLQHPTEVIAYEPDEHLCELLKMSLEYATRFAGEHGGSLRYEIRCENFVKDVLGKSLNIDHHIEDSFANYSMVISNPPYSKLSPEDISAKYAEGRLEGGTNIYTLIMGLSAKLLTTDGEMVFIIPRSFTSGAYFRKFRKQLLRDAHLSHVHVFESRTDAFKKDDVLQENIIVKFEKGRPVDDILISHSAGTADLNHSSERSVPIQRIYDPKSKEQVISIPLNDIDDRVVELVNSWKGGLGKYGMEISTGPVVSHRSIEWITDLPSGSENCLPLLWMQNVRAMSINWPLPLAKKQPYALACPQSERWLLPDSNYVLLRRFSAKEEKQRLTAAPLLKGELGYGLVGIENHLNYIYKPCGAIDTDEAFGLATLFNSKLLDLYFRVFSGNTQVSATEIRSVPLPPLELIRNIGALARSLDAGQRMKHVDSIICELLRVPRDIANIIMKGVSKSGNTIEQLPGPRVKHGATITAVIPAKAGIQ